MQLKQKGLNFKTQCMHLTPVSSMYYICFCAACGVIIKKVVMQNIFWLEQNGIRCSAGQES